MPKMAMMEQVSRPLLGVLIATLAVGVLYFTMLKPGGPEGAPSTQGTTAYQSDITKAKQAVATAGRASVAQGGGATGTPSGASAVSPTHTLASKPPTTTADPPASSTTASSTTASTPTTTTTTTTHATAKPKATAAPPAVKVAGAPNATRHRLDKVSAAIADHKVVALLFYNPAGADDQAVKQELGSVPTKGGRVVKLAVPIGELARYPVISTQVPVTESPTLVLIDRERQATTLVGFASGFEITQLVDAAAATK
jgi:hypothetical protein